MQQELVDVDVNGGCDFRLGQVATAELQLIGHLSVDDQDIVTSLDGFEDLHQVFGLRSGQLDLVQDNNVTGIDPFGVAFERYSEGCKNEHPRDAELHALLARGTAHARSIMEEMLVRVCEHDGIKI